jgi:hypothetical protein
MNLSFYQYYTLNDKLSECISVLLWMNLSVYRYYTLNDKLSGCISVLLWMHSSFCQYYTITSYYLDIFPVQILVSHYKSNPNNDTGDDYSCSRKKILVVGKLTIYVLIMPASCYGNEPTVVKMYRIFNSVVILVWNSRKPGA